MIPLFTFLSACSSTGSSAGKGSAVSTTNGDASTNAGVEVVAQINGQPITKKQLEDRLVINNQGQSSSSEAGEISEDKKKAVLDDLIMEEIVLQEATKDGIFKNSERLRREVMREYVDVKIGGGKEQPTEDEIKALYESQKASLDEIRARHILIKPKSSDAASATAALSKAKEILQKLRAQGEKADFAAMAQQVSDDPVTKDKGGDLGLFTYDKMVPEFSKAAFKLKNKNDFSDVVKTEFGYHIIQLTEDRRGLENNKSSLQMMLAKDKKKNLYKDLLSELRKNASVTIDKDVVAKVTTPDLVPASR